MRMATSGGRSSTGIREIKARFQATLTHLRKNISRAIGSDVRDFGGNSHLLYQGLRSLREEQSKRAGAALIVRISSEPSNLA
jgi:hypothetical protein